MRCATSQRFGRRMSLLPEGASGVVNNSIRLKHCCCNLGGGSSLEAKELEIALTEKPKMGADGTR